MTKIGRKHIPIKWENYLQTHGTAMGTIVAVAFADMFMATVETELLNKSSIKSICWKIYMDDILALSLSLSGLPKPRGGG